MGAGAGRAARSLFIEDMEGSPGSPVPEYIHKGRESVDGKANAKPHGGIPAQSSAL